MSEFKFDVSKIVREQWRWYDKENEIAVSSRARYKVGKDGEAQSGQGGWSEVLRKAKLKKISLYDATAMLFKPYYDIEATRAALSVKKKPGAIPLEMQIVWFKNATDAGLSRIANEKIPKKSSTAIDAAIQKVEQRKFENAIEEHLKKNFKCLEVESNEHD